MYVFAGLIDCTGLCALPFKKLTNTTGLLQANEILIPVIFLWKRAREMELTADQ